MPTGLLYDPVFLEHRTGGGHPERHERLEAASSYLQSLPWFASLVPVSPRSVEREWLEEIHAGNYIQRAEDACRRELPYLDVPDTSISRRSYDVALQATGGVLALADRLMAGDIDNGFALARPPGHHAERDLSLGFCLFNNIAVTARYLQKHHGLEKVLILDWDVHHGNGTQHSFEEDPSVLYVSLHQYPYYPGTGSASETGKGRGQGATLNCPMRAGSNDDDYRSAFATRILPKVDEFRPDIVLISAGFDAHRDDPLAQINLSTEMYAWMTERLMEVAEKHAGGRLLGMLEGGYDLRALSLSVGDHLAVLSGNGGTAA